MTSTKKIAAELAVILLAISFAAPRAATQAKEDRVREIPTINAADAFPAGCVDCHIRTSKRDFRIGTMMTHWTTKASPKLVNLAQGVLPPGRKLKGRHPEVDRAVNDIPAGCLKCHGRDSKIVPAFDRLMHVIHYEGPSNEFVSSYGGECTHCHKYEGAQGGWKIHSAPED